MGAGGGGDGDVLEVDEASGLEALENGLGCLELLGVVPVEKSGEIDELSVLDLCGCLEIGVLYRDKKPLGLHSCLLHVVIGSVCCQTEIGRFNLVL